MIQKTDISSIRETALDLLYRPFKINEKIPFLNNNPIIENFIVFPGREMINLSADPEQLDNAIDFYSKQIADMDLQRIFITIKKPYRLEFFNQTKEWFSEKDYNDILSDIYKNIEFPNWNNDVDELIDCFESINKDLFMSKEGRKIHDSLPDEITIYRGIYSESYYKAVSWTTDRDTAEFFANRFQDGYIVTGKVKKESVFACYESEKEVVVNPNHVEILEIASVQDGRMTMA